MFRSKELKEKVKRIEDLRKENFNIPRMFYLEKEAGEMIVNEAYLWAQKINAVDPGHIFNIRTYGHAPSTNMEQKSTPHITDLTVHQVHKELSKANMEYYCMVDAEVPDDGRMAGNIVITPSPGIRFQKDFVIEFVKKDKRAMVRDINTETVHTISGNCSGYLPEVAQEKDLTYEVTRFLVDKAASFSKVGIILEWTYFCKPAGILAGIIDPEFHPDSHIVWWEYRNYI